jgi:glycosyltransferase involved in cell wall biosynthesis
LYDAHELWPFQWTDGALQEYWTSVEQEHIKGADLVITVNDSIAEEIQRLYRIKKPEVIYNSYGIATSEKTLSEKEFLAHFGAPPEGFRVLFVGGFMPGRNLPRLVEAFGMLDGSTRLFMLGKGEAQTRIERICQKKRISNVHFGQWVPQHELLHYVSKADMGIIPYMGDLSLNNLFCTPNKLFEFIESGIPVCASDLPELRRIVKGWGIGDVYPMTTPAEMAQAISDCASRCKQGEFGEAKLRAAREEFGWPKQEQKLLRLYGELGV